MMEINCPERTVSTVPLQALALLHSPFAARNAVALADRILEHAAAGRELPGRVRLPAPLRPRPLAARGFAASASSWPP